MFFIFPWLNKGYLPRITTGLILVQIVLFLILWPVQRGLAGVPDTSQRDQVAHKLISILASNDSNLAPDDRVLLEKESSATPFPTSTLLDLFKRVDSPNYILMSETRYRWRMLYPTFQGLQDALEAHPDRTTPFQSLGFHPDGSWFPGLLTHQFLHAGVWHLFFNMLFLWVLGNILEEKLGGKLLILFLAGGIAGALAQKAWGVPPGEVLVGASGAISALMGYGLVAYSHAKVRLFYFVMLFLTPRYGSFLAPLWFWLPIWLSEQLFMASMTVHSQLNSIGYAAHVGGFAFGMMTALIPLFRKA